MISFQLVIEQILNGLLSGSMYTLMAIGLSLIWGILGIFNFAHGAFYMLGGYFTYYLIAYLGLNPFISVIISAIAIFFVGMVLEIIFIRPLNQFQGTEFHLLATAIVTLGLAIFLENIILLTFGGATETVAPVIPGKVTIGFYSVSKQIIAVFFITGSSLLGIALFVRYTKTGLAMLSLAQDHLGASLVGVNYNRIYPITFGVSATLAGIAGALLAPVYSINPTVGWTVFPYSLIVVIMAGLGSLKGVIFAGFLIGLIKGIGTIWITQQWVMPIFFGLVILIVLMKPSGLFGVREI